MTTCLKRETTLLAVVIAIIAVFAISRCAPASLELSMEVQQKRTSATDPSSSDQPAPLTKGALL